MADIVVWRQKVFGADARSVDTLEQASLESPEATAADPTASLA